MNKRSKLGCFGKLFIFTTLIILILAFVGLVRFEYFHIRGQVLETIEPNIYYIYTYQGTNEYGQTQENYEIINREYQTNGISHMITLGRYPNPGDTIDYSRVKIYIYWPRHLVLWFNFVK